MSMVDLNDPNNTLGLPTGQQSDGLVDPSTITKAAPIDEVSSLSYGLDTHAAKAGDPSIWQSAQDVITKAVPLTGLDIVNSFANTGIELGNFLTGNNVDKWSIAAEAPDVEKITGQTGLDSYYQEHKQGIDMASLAAGSLIPGLAGVKLFKAGSAALGAMRSLNEAGEATNILSRATGLLPSVQMKAIQTAAEKEILNPSSMFNTLAREKWTSIALGVGDQALQGLVYEAATVATMKASPLMDDSSLSDIGENLAFGALAGGAIGGAFEGIGIASKFGKMARDMDYSTKAQQIITQVGDNGNYSVGDKVNTMLNSIISRPEASSDAGRLYAKQTSQQGFNLVKEALAPLADDPEVTNGLADITTKGWQSGQLDADSVHERFNNIASAQRLTDDTIPQIDDGTFYVNKRSLSNRKPNTTKFSDLVTSNSEVAPGSDFNQRFQMKDGSPETAPQVGTWNDTFIDVNGDPQVKYSNAQQAWNAGMDMFHSQNGEVIVNPAAPNIEQLAKIGESRALSQAEEHSLRSTGKLPATKPGQAARSPIVGTVATNVDGKPGATILNIQDGSITDAAIATVGDHGNIGYTKNGVTYGDGKFSPQDIGSEITPDTKSIDASARYAWFSKRGIIAGDDVSSTDIPALERLYKQLSNSSTGVKFKDNAATLGGKYKVTLDGGELPDNGPDLLEMIKQAKDEQISSDLGDSNGMSSEEAALRANVSQDYIANGFHGSTSDMMQPENVNSSLKHIKLWYDIGNLNMKDGMLQKGMVDTGYRVQLVKAAAQDAMAAWHGEKASSLLIKGDTANAGLGNAPGGKFLSFSGADYATYPQQFERVGRVISGINQDHIQEINDGLASSTAAIRRDGLKGGNAGANLNMFEAVRQRAAGNKFTFLPADLEAKYIIKDGSAPTGNVAVLKDSISKDPETELPDWNPNYIPTNFIDAGKIVSGEVPSATAGLRNYYQLHPLVADFEKAAQDINDKTLVGRNNFNSANGLQRSYDTGTLHVPPVDTKKYPYFAYLRAKPGTGMGDDSVHVITAQSASDLADKINMFGGQYDVATKTGDTSIEAIHKLTGDYDYNRNFADNRVSADAANKGVLNNIIPETNVENTIQRRYDFLVRNRVQLNRDFVELGNGQTFAELKGMGDMINGINQSKTGYVPPSLVRSTANPYNDFINTALNISPKEQYTTWQFANEKLESMFGTAFDALKSGFQSAAKGIIPFDKASDLAESYGLGKIYEQAAKPMIAYYKMGDNAESSRALSKFVGGANTVLSTGIIRLDAYQSLIHAITTPMLAAVEAVSAKSQIIKGLVTTPLPDIAKNGAMGAVDANGNPISMPSTVKLLFNAVKNYWDDSVHAKYGDMYDSLGADKTVIGIHKQMMDQLALPEGSFAPTSLTDKLKAGVNLGLKLSASNWTNTFNHFISADVGRQIFEAAGFTGQDLTDQVMTFVNRVQGNYIAGQRPVAFQGPIGQALGLFQTFGMNMLQNLTRYVANGEGKTLGLLGGLQTSLFGLQGMPGFNFINQHLVGTAAGNSNGNDLYSGIASALGGGKGTLGDYLLYGATSNILDANLYSRGDISPRNITGVPINPMDFPIIRGGIAIAGNIIDTAGKIVNGGSLPASLLTGLEHNGLSRPLSGLAQLAQGFATDREGNVIGTTQGVNGQSEMFSMANFSRLMGARPLDEAVALGVGARYQYYQTKNEAKIQNLASALKTQMYGDGVSGRQLDPETVENFATKYAADGGDVAKFNSWAGRASMKANGATANKFFGTLAGSGRAQNAMMEMGGKQLPDYLNSGSTATAEPGNNGDTSQ